MTDILTSDLFIESLGAITGLVYLFFSIRQNIWLWPWGIITSLIYAYVFFQAKFYAGMSLQFYYFGISIYGWSLWFTGKQRVRGYFPVKKTDKKRWIIFICLTFFLTVIIWLILDRFTDSPVPFWDAFITSGSIVATWMLARKYLEHWLFWILIDLVAIATYIYKELYPTVILFLVYTVMAIVGYYQWRKEMIKPDEN